jgi:putative transcriptional regulator
MIKIKVSDMLGKHKMTRKQLAQLTGIRPNTIGALYNETVQRIDIESLNKICKVFNCKIDEIIEYVPDKIFSFDVTSDLEKIADGEIEYTFIKGNEKE